MHVIRVYWRMLMCSSRPNSVNISNAALFGLKQDLKLVGNQYNDILLI